jgi:tripartite-type tricarboxylate transporter receptor subunit TctC
MGHNLTMGARMTNVTTMKSILKPIAFIFGILAAQLQAASAQTTVGQSESVSFAGKRINLLIGFSPIGFGYDTYGRILARYLGKHLPGNPSVVPQNRPGAGSMGLANYIYNAAPKDGTEIALVGRGVAMDPLLNGDAATAKFDATRFYWLGSMNNEVAGFFITSKAPVKNLNDVLAGQELQVGSNGAGSDPQMFAVALNAVMRTKLMIIAGYPGMNEILLGMSRGELDGVLGYSWGVARAGSADQMKTGELKLIMQIALHKHKDLPDVPLVTDLVPPGEGKQVLELMFSRQSMGRPIVAPPGLDPHIAASLRKAFADVMHDPEFIAECDKINLETSFVSGEEVQELVGSLYRLPANVVTQAQKIVAVK